MKGAEEDYLELEKELDKQIRQMESTHPGYDEFSATADCVMRMCRRVYIAMICAVRTTTPASPLQWRKLWW